MHLVIEGKRYDFAALNRASLLDLIEMQKQTGLTIGSISAMYADLEQRAKDPEFDFFGDPANLLLMAAIIWLSRRKAGERGLSFEDSADVPLEDIEFVPDEDDRADESAGGESPAPPDPTRPRRGSGRGASSGRSAKAPSRSKT